ncbi:homeobox-leucine zipper protein GLABRA 2-like [Ipomoea triloba]|uniref:homeobox-leucine zipper protein GLABRA 2-like n=1 Tax=Ipomoea triloba TaxID=35885 RepID=UPI00125E43F6|nr:homeobox-leucine zipper protein GLABRA 2-like [Ipomoea triloba]XP_031126015.1 homeobox-leucine zipper protein GLABRA 2-like [Ipomoea triloba]
MGVVEMSNNHPASRPVDSFPSPALSLSLAGIFRDAAAVRAGNAADAETAEEGSARGRREETVEISSENYGPARSRSDDDFDGDREHDDNYNDEDDDNAKKKKRKKYHRHTAEQIREMEAYVLNSPVRSKKDKLSVVLTFAGKNGSSPENMK